jgi:AbrB family looped-hinge helix DNA binding protein
MNATIKLSSKYQVVIPRAARKALGLKAGDELLMLCKLDRVVMFSGLGVETVEQRSAA